MVRDNQPAPGDQSIRFVTPDVALVNAANTHYGSVILASADSGAVCNEKGRDNLAHSLPSGVGGCAESALTLRQAAKGPAQPNRSSDACGISVLTRMVGKPAPFLVH